MWIRADLKARAKAALHDNWLNAIVVSLIAGILGVGAASHAGGSSQHAETISETAGNTGLLEGLLIAGTVFLVAVIVIAIGLAIKCLLTNPVEVGRDRFYIVNRGGDKPSIGMLFSCFEQEQRPYYRNVVKTMFLVDIKILIGVLLFIVPGIYLMYVYRMVPFILATNPGMDSFEVQQLSKVMMAGQKWNAFILDLSFIGWDIVASIVFGLGYLLLDPYKAATNAELYDVLRRDAVDHGWVNWADLPDLATTDNVEVLW